MKQFSNNGEIMVNCNHLKNGAKVPGVTKTFCLERQRPFVWSDKDLLSEQIKNILFLTLQNLIKGLRHLGN
jgi:hypothetical protein